MLTVIRIRVSAITRRPQVRCVGLWVSSSGAESLALSCYIRMQTCLDERGWRPPLPPPRAKPSVASWPALSFQSYCWKCWPLSLQVGASTLRGPPQKQAASSLSLKVPSFGPRAVPRPWGQADASTQDLRVAVIISNEGLFFTKVIADSLLESTCPEGPPALPGPAHPPALFAPGFDVACGHRRPSGGDMRNADAGWWAYALCEGKTGDGREPP